MFSRTHLTLPAQFIFNHTTMGHQSYLLSGDDDDAMTLTGKRHGRRSTTQHSTVLLDYLPLMWIREHAEGWMRGAVKAYFLVELK